MPQQFILVCLDAWKAEVYAYKAMTTMKLLRIPSPYLPRHFSSISAVSITHAPLSSLVHPG
jgi:hypothetical protein